MKNAPSNYNYPFEMHTLSRTWVLYAYTKDEARMWIDAINYTSKSVKKYQNIIKTNEEELKAEME